jgi:hypothetical protein
MKSVGATTCCSTIMTMLRSSLALVALAACAREPARSTTSPSPSPATTPPTSRSSVSSGASRSPASPTTATAPPSFAFLPEDLRDRSPVLVDIQCPAGTKRVETHGYGQTHRHCETPSGTYEGPIVEFSATSIHLRGTHNGLREGVELSANEGGGAIESRFEAGHPVGHYRYRMGTITVAEGDFDRDGKLDGDWVFRMPVSGAELSKTKMVHGTGSIELWDWRYGAQPQVIARLQCKNGLLDGTEMFHRLSAPGVSGYRVEGEYRSGIADGAWKLIRISDGVVLQSGTYKAGAPTGVWKMIAQRPCIAQMHGGDTVDCIYGEDLPYTCSGGGTCKFDTKPKVRGGQDIERVEDDDIGPPHSESKAERCQLGEPYLAGPYW